jgi:hypothetical protein
MKKKSKKKGACYLCGKLEVNANDPITDDHIPPKSLFDILPGQTIKGDLITVGAHKSCNKAHQHDDEYLVFAAVIGAVEKNAMAQRVFENL